MKFRNYVPHDKQLQEGKLAPPVLPKFEDPAAAVPPPPEKKEVPSCFRDNILQSCAINARLCCIASYVHVL